MTYATHWLYSPEPRCHHRFKHHIITGRTADDRRIDLAEIDMDFDANLDPCMSDAEAAQIARIMAAAPDMLAALKSAQESIATFIGVHGYPKSSGAFEILTEVTAAIAKAEERS